jgi:hypothetical protein
MLHQLLGGDGRPNGFAHPVKKTTTDFFLQTPDGMTDSGLGQVQFLGSSRKSPCFHDSLEGFQLSKVEQVVHSSSRGEGR